MPAPGEPLYLPEDLAKLHALWTWRRERCPSCDQRRGDWLDDDGVELRDPPYEIAWDYCPACAWLADPSDDDHPDGKPSDGERPYFRRLDD